uniref:SRR1 domain-containing protein n=1 Tax=Caenorhabditis japonica TaxID=281687 RepID=A0A8R1E1Z9_CAEJA
MEDDGFTLVTGKRASKNRIFKKTDNGSHIRVDGSEKDIERAMNAAKVGILKSGLGKWLCRNLEALKDERRVQKVYIVGNGHFDRSEQPGAHQLALFLEISEKFDAEIIFQEPACSASENLWLESRNITVRKQLDTEIDIVEDSEALTILGIIHGEHEILNSFLEHNWKTLEQYQNVIVVGNNYGGVDWELSKFSAQNPKINEFFQKAIITPFPEIYEPHSSAFSCTVIMSLNEDL